MPSLAPARAVPVRTEPQNKVPEKSAVVACMFVPLLLACCHAVLMSSDGMQVSLSTDAALRKKVNAHVTNLEQEVSVLSQLRHDNIVRYYVSQHCQMH